MPKVDYFAEQKSRNFTVVGSAVSGSLVISNVSPLTSFSQNRVPKGNSTQRCGIKSGEWMKRTSLDLVSLYGGVKEAVVEVRVMGDKNGSGAPFRFSLFSHLLEK